MSFDEFLNPENRSADCIPVSNTTKGSVETALNCAKNSRVRMGRNARFLLTIRARKCFAKRLIKSTIPGIPEKVSSRKKKLLGRRAWVMDESGATVARPVPIK